MLEVSLFSLVQVKATLRPSGDKLGLRSKPLSVAMGTTWEGAKLFVPRCIASKAPTLQITASPAIAAVQVRAGFLTAAGGICSAAVLANTGLSVSERFSSAVSTAA
jgi:hypothetical protein